MCLKHGQETINSIPWGCGATILGNVTTKLSKREECHQHTTRIKLSKANIQRLENAGFKWSLCKKFDKRFNDLMAFKTEYGHCNVPVTRSRNNKHLSLGLWCSGIRRSQNTIKEGRISTHRLSKADISASRTQDLSGTNDNNFRHWFTTYSVSISVIHNAFQFIFTILIAYCCRYLLSMNDMILSSVVALVAFG